MVDEADRLRTDSIEQLRATFNEGSFGLVLIGMPGIKKRMARYPQLYSRIGFTASSASGETEMRRLLSRHRLPPGVNLPSDRIPKDALAAILRKTGGNFRSFTRLLIRMERILQVNSLKEFSKDVVEAARASLIIGSS